MKDYPVLLKLGAVIALLTILFVSCKDKKDEFTVTVQVPEKYNGKTVYFYDPMKADNQALDSMNIENNSFSITGPSPSKPLVRIAKFSDDILPALFVCEKGNIQIVYDSITHRPIVNGSPLNDTYQEYNNTLYKKLIELQQLYNGRNLLEYQSDLTPEQKENQHNAENKAKAAIEELAYNFIKTNKANPLGQIAFYTESIYINPQKQLELSNNFDDDFRNTQQYKLKEQNLKAQISTAVGSKYVNVSGKNVQDNTVRLSDYVGKKKYVIIDFWASWSTPCETTIPHLESLYNEFHSKGLEIVSISLDTDSQSWLKASKTLHIKWPQLTNLKGYDDPIAKAYGIIDIPELLIIDHNGTIIARGIRGGELQDKIDELMDYKIPPSPIG